MSEWARHSLTDLLMFSKRTYYRLFAVYNNDTWPLHVLAAAIGIAIVAAIVRGGARLAKVAACLLGLCWLWVGFVFHARYYATINTAGGVFALAFAAQGVLLLWCGLRRDGLAAGAHGRARHGALLLMLIGLVGYPLLAPAMGRPPSQAEVFGVAPDPTAVVTLGALVPGGRRRWLLWPIPLLWCATSAATLWTMSRA